MSLSRHTILVLRGVFVITLCIVTYLAMTHRHLPVIDDLHGNMTHILAFYLLALLIDFAFPNKLPFIAKATVLLGYGLGIEVFQGIFTERTFSLLDVVADIIGVMLYVVSIPILKHLPWLRSRWLY